MWLDFAPFDYGSGLGGCETPSKEPPHFLQSGGFLPGLSHGFGRRRTPGLPLSRNSTPARSSVTTTRFKDSVRALTAPSNPSIRRTVPSATLDFFESSFCAHPRSALAARMCLPVMTINGQKLSRLSHNFNVMS